VRHVMADDPKTARPDMGVAEAAGLMASYDIGFVPIVGDDDGLVGLVTDRDLVVRVLAARQDPATVKLSDIATTRSLRTISPDASVTEAGDRMAEYRVKRLLVVDDGTFVGVVSLGDVAQTAASLEAVGETVRDISESPATTEVHGG